MESERNCSAKKSRQCARTGSEEKEERGEAQDQKEVPQTSRVTGPRAHPRGEGEETEFLWHATCLMPGAEWKSGQWRRDMGEMGKEVMWAADLRERLGGG